MISPYITTKINTRRREDGRYNPDERIDFKDLEDLVLSLFGTGKGKSKINTPKDLKIAKAFLSQFQEMTDPKTQMGIKVATNEGRIGDYLVAKSKEYDTLAVAIGAEVYGDFIFGKAFDGRKIQMSLGHIPSGFEFEPFIGKIFPKLGKELKTKKFLYSWLSQLAGFLNYDSDGSVRYEFIENFVSEPYIKNEKDGSIIMSYGKTNGGRYKLSKDNKEHWHGHWENPSYDIEKLTNEIYQKIAQIEKS